MRNLRLLAVTALSMMTACSPSPTPVSCSTTPADLGSPVAADRAPLNNARTGSPVYVLAAIPPEREPEPAAHASARAAASALLGLMSDEQKQQALVPLDHELHGQWHFVPRQRRGIQLGAMTDAQRVELHKLLQAALSDAGYLKAMDIVWLESVLEELEGRRANDNTRDPGRYTLLLFGDPAPGNDAGATSGGAWGWRFEGHHLSLNFTYAGGEVVTTPMFMGTAPAVVPHGLHAGKRILADEHNLAFAFIATLTDEQREQMMIGDEPGDIVTGPGRERSLREPAGIAFAEMTEAQQEALINLISVYVLRVEGHLFSDLSVKVFLDSEDIHFAWIGSTNPEEPHYYRIFAQDQFVIEYCTRDGGVDHVHGVFHDLTDPLAEDLLRRHFEEHHADQ